MADPMQRFSSRVDHYLRYRPRYPQEMLDWLRGQGMLGEQSVVADVGSGTGFLAELFLRNGHRVHGVEPNREMRQAGEKHLAAYGQFVSVEGTAEATGLAQASVDLVAAGQAFHWFDREKARAEFVRILRPDGWVVLAWNERLEATAFLAEYERLLQAYSTDYAAVDHRRMTDEVMGEFFAPAGYRLGVFANEQAFDWEGLKGRVLSSSYVPEAGQPRHQPMMEALEAIFRRHQLGGRVQFLYETKAYCGQLRPR